MFIRNIARSLRGRKNPEIEKKEKEDIETGMPLLHPHWRIGYRPTVFGSNRKLHPEYGSTTDPKPPKSCIIS